MAPQQQKTMMMMSIVIMPISTAVALFLPSGLTWYFFLSAFLHTTQSWFLHQQWFRSMVGLRPLNMPSVPGTGQWQAPRVVDISAPRVSAGPQVAAPAAESIIGSIRSTLADAKEKLNERSDKGDVERSHKAAREYDEKRALEEQEKMVARLQQKRRGKGGRY
jgi:YidC/Oxa1 family membrane protein insertase